MSKDIYHDRWSLPKGKSYHCRCCKKDENLALRKLVGDLSSVRMLLISLQNRMTFEEKKIYENFMIKSKEWLEKAGK